MKRLFKVTVWSGDLGRSFPERVELIEAYAGNQAMKKVREKDPDTAGRITVGLKRKGCESGVFIRRKKRIR